MFSIVIPLYNKENSIQNTIKSILTQTYKDFEVIVINDGSTDNSVKVVEQFDDKRIRLIHQDNQGVSAARNKGIKEAKHEWISFLDADDLWRENHLYEYYQAIKNNPEINWVISGYTVIGKYRKTDRIYGKQGILNNVFDDLLSGLSIHTSTVCVQKKLFEKFNDLYFREGMNNSEDREVWYKLSCIDQQPYYINQTLSEYDSNVPHSLTKNKTGTREEHYLSMEERIVDSTLYKNLVKDHKIKLKTIIRNFNTKAIKGRYLYGGFERHHKELLPTYEYYIFSLTKKFPKLIRFLIAKLC